MTASFMNTSRTLEQNSSLTKLAAALTVLFSRDLLR